MAKTLVALYDDYNDVHGAHRDLLDAGFENRDLSVTALDEDGRFHRLSGEDTTAAMERRMHDGERLGEMIDTGNVVDHLKSNGLPDDDAHAYAEGIRRGGILLLVHSSDERADEAAAIMDRYTPGYIDERITAWREAGWTGFRPEAERLSAEEIEAERAVLKPSVSTDRETRIPIAEEEVHVGKRVVPTGRVRIHTWTQERPFDETVRLSDERVTVERRDVDRPIGPGGAAFEESSMELEESREEVVVGKETRVTGEVVVKRVTEERDEQVHDTERRTQVDVEKTSEEERRAQRPEQRPEQR